jgi:D-alanine-D-alanine ligase
MTQEQFFPRPLRVAVLAGGDSAERLVSLESGHNVATALQERGHSATQIDPAHSSLDFQGQKFDIIFPMLHGTGAEDGTLQARLKQTGIPWLGSSEHASRLTFNKISTRSALQTAGLPVAPGVALHSQLNLATLLTASRSIGYPQVIKPAEQGSSVGISIVHQETDLPDAVQEAVRWGKWFVIERFIAGREVTVPVVDNVVFPTVEILPSREWYDYTAKYEDEATRYSISPNDLPTRLGELVRRACQVCGVSGISRTDLRVDESGRTWVLEINTIPGMTSHSLVPMAARSLGISLGELCEQLLLKKLGWIMQTSWEARPQSLPHAA